MKHSRIILYSGLLMLMCPAFVNPLSGQPSDESRKISFPDIPGYKTMICDLHQHTVFSDGHVWPTIRVAEALADGLDAISITDHLEYQPHSEDIPHPDRNRVYQLALEAAKGQNLLVINGSEVTRDMPPGHANAIFLTDANKLIGLDSMEVFREAKKQGAFIIWNHPHWYAQSKHGTAVLTKMHRQLLKEGLIHGIEVVNEHSYSDEALKIALDNKLAIMGASDIHDLIDWQFRVPEGGHRPVTLVFATEKTEESLKEALYKGRTVVWFDNTLIGKKEFLVPLVQQSLSIRKTEVMESYTGKSTVVAVSIENSSDVDYILENQKDYSFYDHADIVTVKANSVTEIQVKPLKELKTFNLRFKVLNAVTAPNTHPLISLNVYTVIN
ncbi:MAG TPA: Sb-PDE family phosphodiesterase [Bacteroidales bacterium]|nr:Sb-PDE family phosphodiesterase [Bacteroidales bacterium]